MTQQLFIIDKVELHLPGRDCYWKLEQDSVGDQSKSIVIKILVHLPWWGQDTMGQTLGSCDVQVLGDRKGRHMGQVAYIDILYLM